MDLELLKALGPWVAAAVALLTCILNFINGRLSAAEDIHARRAIYSAVWDWSSTFLFFVGCALISFWQFYLTSCAFYFVAFVIQTILFLQKKQALHRVDIVVYSLQTGIVFSIIVMALVFSLVNKVLMVQQGIIENQVKLSDGRVKH